MAERTAAVLAHPHKYVVLAGLRVLSAILSVGDAHYNRALARLALVKGPDYDAVTMQRTIADFTAYLRDHPEGDRRDRECDRDERQLPPSKRLC